MKNVQISKELFFNLLEYHLLGNDDVLEEIEIELKNKIDRLMDRELYTTYKTAKTQTEQEKARQEYLDRKGYHKDFRW
ncbi:complexin-2 [Clostridium algidicarnis]|uniref:Complexin-2 n=1 Tax=Clostridium algidicarnis DSM 15099 TaxID=1121295 RepID=A0A2S6FUJ7_9CLOT|nr:complexin-2 [Clostridium algidicarnis]PPK43243.1 hypothetical protein BD821_1319 [Clostridium algidicarnis DSM 15099]